MTVLFDTREPDDPHPWAKYLPEGWRERERFERELKRGRYAGRLIVVVEGSLQDVLAASRGISRASIIGTVAAWASRYAPIIFAGSVPLAADLAFRCLAAQIRDAQRVTAALEQAV